MVEIDTTSIGNKNKNAPKATPLPVGQIFSVALINLCETVNINVLFPFLAFMVEDLGHGGASLGYYAGGLAAAFCGAQFCSSLLWGWFSDKYGRKPAVILGTLGAAVGIMTFGTAKTYTQAIAGRMCSGFLSGNLGVAKSFLTEITDDTNRGKGFSYFSLAWAIGTVIAPLTGGMLCKPAEKYPTFFSKNGLFAYYPYLLPCLVCVGFNLCGSILCAIYMKETRWLIRDSSKNKGKNSENNSPIERSTKRNRKNKNGFNIHREVEMTSSNHRSANILMPPLNSNGSNDTNNTTHSLDSTCSSSTSTGGITTTENTPSDSTMLNATLELSDHSNDKTKHKLSPMNITNTNATSSATSTTATLTNLLNKTTRMSRRQSNKGKYMVLNNTEHEEGDEGDSDNGTDNSDDGESGGGVGGEEMHFSDVTNPLQQVEGEPYHRHVHNTFMQFVKQSNSNSNDNSSDVSEPNSPKIMESLDSTKALLSGHGSDNNTHQQQSQQSQHEQTESIILTMNGTTAECEELCYNDVHPVVTNGKSDHHHHHRHSHDNDSNNKYEPHKHHKQHSHTSTTHNALISTNSSHRLLDSLDGLESGVLLKDEYQDSNSNSDSDSDNAEGGDEEDDELCFDSHGCFSCTSRSTSNSNNRHTVSSSNHSRSSSTHKQLTSTDPDLTITDNKHTTVSTANTVTNNNNGKNSVLNHRKVVLVTLNYGTLAMAYIVLEETIPLFLKLDTYQGGFQFNSMQIGFLLSTSGGVMLFFTFFFLPKIANYSKYWLFHFGALCSIPIAFAWPFLALLNYEILSTMSNKMISHSILWGLLIFTSVIKSVIACITFTAVTIQINHSVTDEYLGAANGLGQSMAALTRAIGPAFGGMLWSLSIKNNFVFFNFIAVGFILIICVVINQQLGVSLDIKKKHKTYG